MAFCRTLGSLRLAIFLIAALAAILIFGTFFESLRSTELAQRFIYTSWWFDFYLTLFALNVFCAVVTRYPFKKRHTGFIITHAGLLMICLGSALNRHLGVEGQMYLREGETTGELSMAEKVLEVRLPNEKVFKISADPVRVKGRLNKRVELDGEYGLSFLDAQENMAVSSRVEKAGEGAERNPAVLFELKSEMAGFNEEHWLVYFDESNPERNIWSMGPAVFRIYKALSDEEADQLLQADAGGSTKNKPVLTVSFPESGVAERIAFDPDKPETVELSQAKGQLSIINYFPNARVVSNQLVNEPGATPNPAVQLELTGPDGKTERHTVFELFPEFDTLHGSDGSGWSGAKLKLTSPSGEGKGPRAEFLLVQPPDENLRFSSQTARGGYKTGPVELGVWQEAGWMDFQFRIKEYYPRAHVIYDAAPVSGNVGGSMNKGNPGVRFELSHRDPGGRVLKSDPLWMLFGETREIWAAGEPVTVTYRYDQIPVPFSIKLVDFARAFYPGTRSPASYESDVVLHDHSEGLTKEQKIYMNHPLDYKGYRVFQSSFVEVPPGEPEISVFQVAKAPGTPVIYTGAVVLMAGIITMFYISPVANPKNL